APRPAHGGVRRRVPGPFGLAPADGAGAGRITLRRRRAIRVAPGALEAVASSPHVDPLAAKRDALGRQVPALACALRERAVGAPAPPPRQVGLVGPEQHGPGEARRPRRDVAVGGDEPLGNLAHPAQHGVFAGLPRFHAPGPKASIRRFWYSLSS